MSRKAPLIDELLVELESGSLDAANTLALQELLREDAAARKQYVQWQLLSAALHLESAVGDIQTRKPERPPVESVSLVENATRPWKSLLSLAAGIALCLVVSRWAYLEIGKAGSKTLALNGQASRGLSRLGQGRSVEATSQGIAVVTRLVDAKWDDESSAADVGSALTAGPIKLAAGYAQIEFFCGATVVLEGPAEMELISSTAAKFHSGRLRAQVPPAARGFTIDVNEMTVVDLGTEFGLAVSPAGADVQVFDGEVELHRPDTAKQLVSAGQAVIHDDDGRLSDATTTPDRFIDLAALDTQARDQTAQRYQRWLAYSQQLRQDPRLIAYYAMDETHRWSRKLLNKARRQNAATAAAELDGAIVGADRVSGRWPSKDALEFKQPGDRVRVNIPGEFRSLTFAAWVKIDSLDRWYNSLFLTDNYQRGEPHWQILDTGQLFFSVRPSEQMAGPEHKEVLSSPFWNPSLSGKWLHLATTYDVDSKQTTHYLDGKIIHQETIPDLQLVQTTRIGMASIGNWAAPTKDDDHFAIRNLNGSLDELAIFGDALSPDEIAKMYESGKL